MVNLAGNIVCRNSWGLNSRALLIPWMKKNSAIYSSKGRVYYSSFPVKYIPKKFGKTKESNATSMPMKGSENREMPSISEPEVFKVEVSNRGKSSQRSFGLDHKSQNQNRRTPSDLTLQESEEEIHYDSMVGDYGFMREPEELVQELCINQKKDRQNQDLLLADKAKQDAEKLAIELLATRAYTKAELRKKLIGKRFTLDIVDAVIMEFQSRGLVNDCLYAEAFSRSRWSSSSWGPRRIKQALFMKGVGEVDAEKAIKLVFEDGDSGGDQESMDSRLGFSKLSMDHLYVQASKQWLRSRDASSETRKTRLIRWLQYRGFNWVVISFIVKKLESEQSP